MAEGAVVAHLRIVSWNSAAGLEKFPDSRMFVRNDNAWVGTETSVARLADAE